MDHWCQLRASYVPGTAGGQESLVPGTKEKAYIVSPAITSAAEPRRRAGVLTEWQMRTPPARLQGHRVPGSLAIAAVMPDHHGMRFAFAALTLPALILSAPLGAQPDPPAQAAPAPAELSRIPGVTVKYYNVAGSTPGKILAAMKSQRSAPTSSRWSIGVDVQKATTGTKCRVVRAKAEFKAEVDFPRLVVTRAGKEEEQPGEEKLEKFLPRWQAHLATLDRQQAAYLRSIYEQLPEVERAAMASSCQGARAAAERVIARIRERSPTPAGR